MYYIQSEKYNVVIQTDNPNSLEEAVKKAGEMLKSEVQLRYDCMQSSGKLTRDLYDASKRCIGIINLEWSFGKFKINSRINYF